MALEAGRELDALVAERVMGLEVKPYESLKGAGIRERFGEPWTPIRDRLYGTPSQQWEPVKPYSTDIGAAWEVLKKVKRPDLYIEVWCAKGEQTHWICWIKTEESNIVGGAGAPTAPHAICLAALKACGVEVG